MVAIANGEQLQCQSMCRGFKWTLLGEEYITDAFLVPLGSCDMILGIQWLSTLGSILWNFEDLIMEFQYKGKRHVLRGSKKVEVGWLGKNKQKALCYSIQMFALQIQPAEEVLEIQ